MSPYVPRLGSTRTAARLRFPGAFRKPRRVAMLSVHTSPSTSPARATPAG